MRGITVKPTIGIGDGLQFSSLPENYFRETGERLLDISRPWFFDHNPFVVRDDKHTPSDVTELWNFSPKQFPWPQPRSAEQPKVYLSNAEIYSSVFGVKNPGLIRPRLYRFEDYPWHRKDRVYLQTQGKSHGPMPERIVQHVLQKYGIELYHIGPGERYGLPHVDTPTPWHLAQELSERARMLICLDSGPAWIAACYPDIVVKKVRTRPTDDQLKTWVPLEIANIHSHWDDRCAQIFNTSELDIGFTYSYRKL